MLELCKKKLKNISLLAYNSHLKFFSGVHIGLLLLITFKIANLPLTTILHIHSMGLGCSVFVNTDTMVYVQYFKLTYSKPVSFF